MKRALLDTDTLSYALKGNYAEVSRTARQYIRVFGYFSISVVTIAEVIRGHEKDSNYQSLADFEAYLDQVEVFSLNVAEATLAGRIIGSLERRGSPIGAMDPFIAAIATERERVLATNNLRHYQRIVDAGFPLELDNWRA